MINLALKRKGIQPRMQYGQVLDVEGGRFVVRADDFEVSAERAASCLLLPRCGDEVLLVLDDHGTGFILAVLRQQTAEGQEAELAFDHSVKVTVKHGGLSLSAEQNLNIGSDREIVCAAPKMGLHADEGEATFDRLTYLGRSVTGHIKNLKTVAVNVEQIFSRLTQRLTNAFRYVREHEDVQTGSTRYLVEETLALHAKNANHVAEEIVSINGKQINLG